MQNYSLFLKVSAIVGDSLPELSESFLGSEGSYRGIGEAVNKLVSSVYVNDPEGKILLQILSQTQRNGIPINKDNFNKFYMGNMGEMMEALVYTCEVHFKHFFPKDLLSGFPIKEKELTAESAAS